MARVSDAEKAQRLNLARALLEECPHLPDAVEHLAGQLGISTRQAYRYLRQAQQLTAPVPSPTARMSCPSVFRAA